MGLVSSQASLHWRKADGGVYSVFRARHRRILAGIFAIAVLHSPMARAEPPDSRAPRVIDARETLVGVNYFAGWWEEQPNKWQDPTNGRNWLEDFPERTPLLGKYNSQAVMDKEIAAAAEHGVDFFSILWYSNDPGQEREKNARFLNRGLDDFLNSKNASRMAFMIEFCNHPPYDATTDEQWARYVKTWVSAMKHPSYLRVGKRLVFKIHSWHHFAMQYVKDIERSRKQILDLRDAVRNAGLGEIAIGAGIGPDEAIPRGHPLAISGLFDFTASYMGVPDLKVSEKDLPYAKLTAMSSACRPLHSDDAVPWLPYLPAGWCPRPWHDPRACFAAPTRKEWKAALAGMAEDLKQAKNLGIPLPDGSVQRAFTIYAWNEFGEGGMVAPTKGDGYMKLQCIKEVFGGRSINVTPAKERSGK